MSIISIASIRVFAQHLGGSPDQHGRVAEEPRRAAGRRRRASSLWKGGQGWPKTVATPVGRNASIMSRRSISRTPRWMAAGAVAGVLLGATALAPETAEAQSETLIGNTGQTDDSGYVAGNTNRGYSQAFTTGTAADGYTITEVVLHRGGATPDIGHANLEVKILGDSSDAPDSSDEVATLTHPNLGDSVAVGIVTFQVQGGSVVLARNTTYHIVLDCGTCQFSAFNWVTTSSANADGTPASGWSIPAAGQRLSGSSWVALPSSGQRFEFQVRGFEGTNNVATGQPVITGPLRVGETLTAHTDSGSDTIMDDDGLGTFTYQWLRSEGQSESQIEAAAAIGTNASTYELTDDDHTKFILVRVTFTDGQGNSESLTSAPTDRIGNRSHMLGANGVYSGNPVGRPTIVGDIRVGESVTIDVSGVTDGDGPLPSELQFEAYGLADQSSTSLPQRSHLLNLDAVVGLFDVKSDLDGDDNDATFVIREGFLGDRIFASLRYEDDRGTAGDTYVLSELYGPVLAANVAAEGNAAITISPSGAAVEVGRTLTAGRGNIMDDNGVPAEDQFTYQWVRVDADGTSNRENIPRATDMTYILTDDDVGHKIIVEITFTDDHETSETRPSLPFPAGAGATVAASSGSSGTPAPGNDVPPELTISSPGEVDEGDAGDTTTLRFEIAKTRATDQPVTVDYAISGTATTADYTHTVSTPITIPAADTSYVLEIDVVEDSVREDDETVIVTLSNPMGADFAGGATTIEGMGTILNDDEFTLSIDSPSVSEGNDGPTQLTFTVTLGAVSTAVITVDYAITEEGTTATEGTDYEAVASGTLSIPAGMTSATFSVTVTGDSDAEPHETIVVTLANPRGGASGDPAPTIEVGTGTGTIRSDDNPSELEVAAQTHALSGIGRTAVSSFVGSVWRRINAHRSGENSSAAMIGGRAIDVQAMGNGDGGRAAREIASLFGVDVASPPRHAASGLGDWDDASYDNVARSGRPELLGGASLTNRSRFALSADNGVGARSLTFWGEGSASGFDSETDEGAQAGGSTTTALTGVDWRSGEYLMGVAVSRIWGDADYTIAEAGQAVMSGEQEVTLTAVSPYLHLLTSRGLGIWGSVGLGSGTMKVTSTIGQTETDVRLKMMAVGLKGPSTRAGDMDISLRGDFFHSQTEAKEAQGFTEIKAGASRMRLSWEGAMRRDMESSGSTSSRFELGARVDSGDGGEGVGLDIAAETRWMTPVSGLEVAGRASALLLHQDSGYREWGAGVTVMYAPGFGGRGMQLSLEPRWNVPRMGMATELWSDARSGVDVGDAEETGASLQARLGYGMVALDEWALATPYGEAEASDEERRLRLGMEYRGADSSMGGLRVDLYGERDERDSEDADSRLMLEAGLDL